MPIPTAAGNRAVTCCQLPPRVTQVKVGTFELGTLVLFGVTAATANAQAYIDPGTGSYIFQLAAAGALAALFTLKRYWARIKEMLRGGRPMTHPSGSADAGDVRLE